MTPEKEKKFKFRARLEAEQAQAQESAPPAYEPSGLDRLNAGVNGASLGFGDELRAMAEAGINWTDSDEPYWDRYEGLVGKERDKMAQYADAEPMTNLALNLAGGVATGGATAARAIPQTMKFLPRALAGLGVAGAEGGLAGYGEAGADNKLNSTLIGAGGGALLKSITGGMGTLFGKGFENIPDMGGRGGIPFTPANVVAPDSTTGGVMRNMLGRSLGGGKIRDQTKAVLNRIESGIKNSDEQYAKKLFDTSTPSAFPKTSGNIKNPQEYFASINKAWKEKGFSELKPMTFKIDDKEIAEEIFTALDDPAMQDFAPDLVRSLSGKIGNKMKRELIQPPSANKFRVKGMGVEPVPPTRGSTGEISGDDLLEARNFFRRAANDTGDNSVSRLQKGAYGKAADVIETKMRGQLDADQIKAFDTELANYGRYSVLRKSMQKAGKSEADLPTPTQVKASLGTGDAVAMGIAPHQKLTKSELKFNAGLIKAAKKAKAAMPSETGGVQQLVQAAIIGSPLTGLGLPLPMAPAAGAAMASGLTTPTAQRALVGQLGPQELIADILRRGATEQIGTGARRAGAGQLTNEF